MGNGNSQEKELCWDYYIIQRAWPQSCLTDALRVACKGKKIEPVNTHVAVDMAATGRWVSCPGISRLGYFHLASTVLQRRGKE